MLRDQLILSPDPVGQMIHIGAGFCDALETYQDAGADKIILIEPNPEMVDALRAKTKSHKNVELIVAAISGATSSTATNTAGRAPLRVLNFADLSSLRMPTDLRDLLPGVRIVSEPMVDTLTFEALCERLPKVTTGKSNWLIIEAPGEELAIAKALIESGNQDLFQNILIRCDQSAYFEGGSAAPEVLQILRAEGYQLENSWVGEDPDWPYFHLSLDVVALENTQLKAEMAKLQAQMSGLDAKLTEATAATNHEKDAATVKLRELQAKLDIQGKEQATARKNLEAQFQKQGEALKKDLGVALRLQMLARTDYQDLQMRYSDLQDEKRLQEELLIKLTQKLGDAAGFLRQLSDQGGEMEMLTEPLENAKPAAPRARTKKKSTRK